jgi:hypothetical protein
MGFVKPKRSLCGLKNLNYYWAQKISWNWGKHKQTWITENSVQICMVKNTKHAVFYESYPFLVRFFLNAEKIKT